MKRIHIIGPGGTGKTTLAAELAAVLHLPHIELDSIHWEENWQEPPVEVFRQRTAEALAGDAWVADGNYSKVRDIVWQRVETVIWLDYPLYVILPRLLKRSLKRVFSKELLWGTNRETFRDVFLSKGSLFVYVLQTHERRRAQYTKLASSPEFQSIKFIRLRSPRQTQDWFKKFTSLLKP